MGHRTAETLTLLLLSACAPRDAENDASIQSDALVIADAVARDAATCALSPPDALPALGGDVVVLDPDAGFQIPAQDGGSPIGVWRVEHVTIFAPPGDFDASASRIGGTAWVIVTASEVQISLALDVAIVSSAGTTTHHDVLALRGSYSRSDPTLHVVPRCAMPALDLDFTSGDTSGTLVLTTTGSLGTETLLLRCARTST